MSSVVGLEERNPTHYADGLGSMTSMTDGFQAVVNWYACDSLGNRTLMTTPEGKVVARLDASTPNVDPTPYMAISAAFFL